MKSPLQGAKWKEFQLPNQFKYGLITICARDATGSLHVVGSGFVVCGWPEFALAVTAAHVVAGVRKLQQSNLRRSHPSSLPEFLPPPKKVDVSLANLVAFAFGDTGVVICRISGIAFDEPADIALLQLMPQRGEEPKFKLYNYLLDDKIPAVGSTICAASFADTTYETTMRGEFSVARRGTLRMGTVSEHYLSGQRLCRGPCVETSIPMSGGMSGGPVFRYATSGNLHVFGVVCSDPDEESIGKSDRAVAARSIVALLPLTRIAGSIDRVQAVSLAFTAYEVAGEFTSSQDFMVYKRRSISPSREKSWSRPPIQGVENCA